MISQALGWDIHRKFSMVSLREMADDGELRTVERRRLEHVDRPAMRQWLSGLPARTPVAMEAAFGWPWVADLLEELGLEPHLAHPPAVRVLAKHQAKSDRCDSDRLAEFQLNGLLPESYLAPPEVRQLRDRTRYRMALSRVRTGIKNRVQAVLHRQGVLHPFSDLFGVKGREFLSTVPLPPSAHDVLNGHLDLLDKVESLLEDVEQWMTNHLKEDSMVKLLMTLPGVGFILAHVLKAEIGELERFPSQRHLASYAGLAPLSDDSADRHGRRHCSPACNHTLRWALIEAACVVVSRCPAKAPRLARLYQRLTHGGVVNKSQAHVAVARELCKLVYVVWKSRQPYCKDPPPRPGTAPRAQPQPNQSSSPNKTKSNNTERSHKRLPNNEASRVMRSDQPCHPMVRRRPTADGQTRS
jgi:transposase